MEFRKFLAWLSTQGYSQDYLSKMTERTYKLHPLYQQYVDSGWTISETDWLTKAKGVIEAPQTPTPTPTTTPTTTPATPTDTTSGELFAFQGWLAEQGYPMVSLTGVTTENYKSHFLYPRFLEAQKGAGLDVQTAESNLATAELNRQLLQKQLDAENDPIRRRILELQLEQSVAELERIKAETKQGSVESWYAKQQALSEGRQLEAQRFNEMLTVKGRAPKAVSPYEEEDRMVRAFEAGRQSVLGELGGDRDWINKWKAQYAPNPFMPSTEQMARRPGEVLQEQILDYNEAATHWDNLATAMKANPSLGQYYQGGFTWETAIGLRDRAIIQGDTAQAELARFEQKFAEDRAASLTPQGQADIIAGMREYQEGGRMTAPPTPEWLKEFVPGQTVGQTIKKIPLETPSGQQWTRTPLSVRQGLAGYADWTGQKWQDILDRQAMMLPQDPRFGARWATARQTRV